MTTIASPFLSRRAAVTAAIALSYVVFAGWSVLHDDGIVGATQKNGFGCICHTISPSDSVTVRIEGPSRVQHGMQASYSIVMTGGPAVAGGFNVASGRGALSPADTTTQLLPSNDGLELTHALPKAVFADTVRWEFLYTAPADTGLDTLFSAGNSVDGNGIPTGDLFNFGANFIVEVTTDPPLSVGAEVPPRTSSLRQNYPNPFNSSTILRYTLEREGPVTISIYDLKGALVAAPVNERQHAGDHQFRWEAANLPSGVYFWQLTASGGRRVGKMLLSR